MRAILLALVLALVPLGAAAGDIKGPESVQVEVGRLGLVALTIDTDEYDCQIVGDPLVAEGFLEMTRDPKAIRYRILGYRPGTVHVVVASAKGGKLLPLFKTAVIVGGGGPPPPPPPPPVPPVSDLAKRLSDAAAADGYTKDNLRSLGDSYKVAAEYARTADVTTGSELQAKIIGILTVRPNKPAPKTVATICNGVTVELDNVLPPSSPNKTLTDAMRKQVGAILDKVGTACLEAAQ